MIATEDVGHEPPAGSVMTLFRYRLDGEPRAVVIGPGHPPYFVFDDGRTEPTAPEAAND